MRWQAKDRMILRITMLSHLEKTGSYVCDNRVTHEFTLSLGPNLTL
jgi:hypothetical protein